MLVGRDPERLALRRVLADARIGHSGVLGLVGEPGIGKTALLEDARELAEGMNILRARGLESEANVPFAGLLEVLRPALGALDRVPPPQAAALEGALALRPGGAQDRFAVGAGTLSLLAAYAEEKPVLVLIDDAHWLDVPSAQALLFAIRRLLADAVAVLIAVRDGHSSLLDGADVPIHRVGGLDRHATLELLTREAGHSLAADVAERLYEATAGNPLGLLEVAPQASGFAAAGIEVPMPVSRRITEAFLHRSASLPARVRRMLTLAAASRAGELAVLARAAGTLGLELADLGPAEAVGLVSLADGAVEFRHPLARAAIYSEATLQERREVHRALARALPDRDSDRRAWHLASAATGPDARASAALEQAAVRARERSAYATSSAAFERAARLTAQDNLRDQLLYAAADAAWAAGAGDRTAHLIDELRTRAPQGTLGARVTHLHGQVLAHRGPVMEGHATLVAAAELAAEAGEPELGALMLADAAHACFYGGAAATMAATTSQALQLLPAAASARAAFVCLTAHGLALVMIGEGDLGADTIRRAAVISRSSPELAHDPSLLHWTVLAALWLREADGRDVIERAVTEGRRQAVGSQLGHLLELASRHNATADGWTAAAAGFHEAIALARETGYGTDLAATLAGLSWLEARQGKNDECRAHAREAQELAARLGVATHHVWTLAALADLELGAGHLDAALVHLHEQQSMLDALGIDDVDLSPVPDLVEIMIRLGDAAGASLLATPYMAQAVAKGQPWSAARAARCAGLLATDDEFDPPFRDALALHAQTPDVFEHARTQLVYGARLRRARRRVDAREQLRGALETFEQLGAAPWIGKASTELAATGETARRRDVSTLDQLTPQEFQVALLLSRGVTTRTAAGQLFLSPKTVEYHLRHVYQKLGIRSRTELSASLHNDPRVQGTGRFQGSEGISES
jgi:DNA-binding CsgD family transcriptional regulator